jgi:hypothetical protein
VPTLFDREESIEPSGLKFLASISCSLLWSLVACQNKELTVVGQFLIVVSASRLRKVQPRRLHTIRMTHYGINVGMGVQALG